jgi:hypothetical protein
LCPAQACALLDSTVSKWLTLLSRARPDFFCHYFTKIERKLKIEPAPAKYKMPVDFPNPTQNKPDRLSYLLSSPAINGISAILFVVL